MCRRRHLEEQERPKEPKKPEKLEKPVGHWRQNSRGGWLFPTSQAFLFQTTSIPNDFYVVFPFGFAPSRLRSLTFRSLVLYIDHG